MFNYLILNKQLKNIRANIKEYQKVEVLLIIEHKLKDLITGLELQKIN